MVSPLSVTELLAPFRADPLGSAVFSDFDGTLAPIVDDPAEARPLPGVVEVLEALAGRYGIVGVVSGRPAAFLRQLLGHGRFVLSGLYGLEYVSLDGDVHALPEAAPWMEAVEAAAAAGDADLPPGAAVERKGLTVVAHFRADPSSAQAAEAWAISQAEATGLVVHPGRMSYELRPPVEADKGSVVLALAEGRNVCFLGDDRGDLAAFDALDRMDLARVVKVAVSSDEAPAELLERADVVVDGPEGALTFLRELVLEDPEGR